MHTDQGGTRPVEYEYFRAQGRGHCRGITAGLPRTQYYDPPTRRRRHTTQQQPATALGAVQQRRAHLYRNAPGDITHGCQQGQASGFFHRLEGDGGEAALLQRHGQYRFCGQMQKRE